MKKRVLFSFLILFLLFLAGIITTLYIVNKTTANLDALLTLHKVEIIRQDLVINVQTVQSNLYTSGTLFGKELDHIVDNVLRLQDRVNTCNDCHHEPDIEEDILWLAKLTDQYKEALSYFITSTADKQRIGRLQAVAADIGDMIISHAQEMAISANNTLRRKTIAAQEKVKRSKQVLIATLVFSATIVFIVAMFLIRSIMEPVNELLKATRMIRQGELGYTSSYKGIREFNEVLESFNTMSKTLEENTDNILSQMRRNETILQTSTDGFVLVNESGVITEVNPALASMTHFTPEEIVDLRFADLVKPEGWADTLNILDKVHRTGSLTTPVTLITRTGVKVAGEMSATYAEMENKGNYFCFIRDITARKKMEEELLKGQKLESLGVLAGGIAHDFNNLLTGIIGYLDLAAKSVNPADKVRNWLDSAKKASYRAQNLTQQLLTFSRGGEPVKDIISVKDMIDESTGFVLSGSNVKCENSYSDNLWRVNADKGQLSQVVQNIILNGAQAMPDGGVILVHAENEVVGEGSQLPLAPGKYVKMIFTDNGPGITTFDLAKIFDPYYTTKEGGNGLGLTICHSIVSKHRGTITVDSKYGEGTTFTVYIPAVEDQSMEKAAAPTPDAEVRGSGRVLVMDDEEQVREIIGEMLTHLGYEGSFAHEGKEAVEMYQQAMNNGQPFDAVIIDLTIPGGMGGKETLTKLLQIDPGVKAIVASGYSNDPVMAEFAMYGFKGVATKPFDVKQLSKVLHKTVAS